MRTLQRRLNGVKHVTMHDAGGYVQVVYTNMMVKSWIMLVSTGPVRCETYLLGWYLVTLTGLGNRLGINIFH